MAGAPFVHIDWATTRTTRGLEPLQPVAPHPQEGVEGISIPELHSPTWGCTHFFESGNCPLDQIEQIKHRVCQFLHGQLQEPQPSRHDAAGPAVDGSQPAWASSRVGFCPPACASHRAYPLRGLSL
eukprot:62956-Chlamydomonas_euryale.AAC.2